MKVVDALRGIHAYPVPLHTLAAVAEHRGIALDDEVSADLLDSRAYRLAKADILLWISTAPDVSQGGQSFTLSSEQRAFIKAEGETLLRQEGDEGVRGTQFGYKGEIL